MKRRHLIFSIAAVILGPLIFFSVIELSTRTISWLSGKGFFLALHERRADARAVASNYKYHPFTGFTFAPNVSFIGSHPNQDGNAIIFVDRHGFLAKDQTLEFEKPPNEIRIACIGGSTTANVNLSFHENWPGQLELLLQREIPDKSVRVINAGVPGFHTSQSIVNLALRVLPFRPDVIVVYHGYNDLKAVGPTHDFKPDYSHIHSVPYGYHEKPNIMLRLLNHSMFFVRTRNAYQENARYKAFVDGLRNPGSDPGRLEDIPPEAGIAFEQHIRALVGLSRSEASRIVLLSFATLHDPMLNYADRSAYEGMSMYRLKELFHVTSFTPGLTIQGVFNGINGFNAILKEVAETEQTGWVDMAGLISNHDAYFIDRIHFSRAGAGQMAQYLLPVVLAELQKQDKMQVKD